MHALTHLRERHSTSAHCKDGAAVRARSEEADGGKRLDIGLLREAEGEGRRWSQE